MDLNRAATFVRVVETGNFTRAAQALHVPTSSVSRSVSKLEEELGVVLLERTTRHVALTEAGRAYFERAREALAGLEEATTLALDAAQEVHGVVRIAFPFELAQNTGALLAPFLQEHPKIRLELTTTSRGAELVGDLVDLALAIGRLPDSSLMSRRLGNATYRLFASPAYVQARGTPRTFADLARHDAVALRAVGGETRIELRGPKGAQHVDMPVRAVGDSQIFVTDAARAGLGIALLPTWVGDHHIARGELVAVLPAYATEMPLHLLTHGSRHLPRRVVLVRDFLASTLAVACGRHKGCA